MISWVAIYKGQFFARFGHKIWTEIVNIICEYGIKNCKTAYEISFLFIIQIYEN